MSRNTLTLDEKTLAYLHEVGIRESDLLARLRRETGEVAGSDAEMQISPEQGAFMHLLVKIAGVRRALEVGTFTGYSSMWVATALPANGRMTCIDRDEAWTTLARRYWREAGIEDRMELRLGDGVTEMEKLLDERKSGRTEGFDMIFLDADKQRQMRYCELSLELLEPGGLLLLDNALRDGAVARPDTFDADPGTRAVDEVNRHLQRDERVDWCLLPVGDGLAIARRR